MKICSCGLWTSLNYVCAWYMAICYMAGYVYLAAVFNVAIGFSHAYANSHIKMSIGGAQ